MEFEGEGVGEGVRETEVASESWGRESGSLPARAQISSKDDIISFHSGLDSERKKN